MSRLIVEVCRVEAVEAHPDADRIEVATVKGWKTCIVKGQFRAGDKCVYFPPDTVLPGPLADRLGVANYLQSLPPDAEGKRPDGGRIRVARLRGVRSYGLIIACENPDWPVGQDVADVYGVRKWEPPQPCTDGESDRSLPAFHTYTDIQNYRNFPHIMKEGEEVVFTEKIHGKNARVGYIRIRDAQGRESFQFTAGSHDVRRKEFVTVTKVKKNRDTREPELDEAGQPIVTTETRRSQFWDALTDPVKALLREVSQDRSNVIVFGEIFGRGLQDMAYGTEFGFRAFDIAVDGRYLDFHAKVQLFERLGVEMVPILYRGPFSKEKVEEIVDGPTTLCLPDKAGKFKGREGIVITPVKERLDFDLGGDGRVILKAISFNYLERKGGTEFH